MKKTETITFPLLSVEQNYLLSTCKAIGLSIDVEYNDSDYLRINIKNKKSDSETSIIVSTSEPEMYNGLFIGWTNKPTDCALHIQDLENYDLIEVVEEICKQLNYTSKKTISVIEAEFTVSKVVKDYKKQNSYKHDKTVVRKDAKHLPYGYTGKWQFGAKDDVYCVCNTGSVRQKVKKEINNQLSEQ